MKNASFLCREARGLEVLAGTSFDKVAAIDVVEHVDDDALLGILDEVRHVASPDGAPSMFTPCASRYVEWLKACNLVLRQIPGHVALWHEAACRDMLERAGCDGADLGIAPSTYRSAKGIDRWLWRVPVVGPWFRFRLCVVARPRLSQ